MKMGRFFQLFCILCVLFTQFGFAQWTHVNGLSQNVGYLTTIGTNIFAQTDNGFFYSSDNGSDWAQANSGFADSLAGAFPADSTNFLLSNLNYQMPSLPAGLNLSKIQIEYSSLITLVTGLAILYPETDLDSIYISIDTGSTALKISQIISDLALYAAGVDTADILSKIDITKMQLSMDGGREWISAAQIMSNISVRAAVKTNYFFFAGTNRGVYRAAVNGNNPPMNWSQANNGLVDTNVHALASFEDVWLLAGTNSGIFVTLTSGATWNAANTGLTNREVLALAVSPGSNGNAANLFAGTYGGGVFLWSNNDSHWAPLNTGLTNMYVSSLAVSGSYLFAGTYGGGLWKLPLSGVTSAPSGGSTGLPSKFSLGQNYPNPFNPSTVISYQLATNSMVSLKVFDLLGREVTTLVNGVKPAGTYTVKFNAVNLPSGVYFYKLTANAISSGQAGSFTETKRLLFLK